MLGAKEDTKDREVRFFKQTTASTLHVCLVRQLAYFWRGRKRFSIWWAQRDACCPLLPKYIPVLIIETVNVTLFGKRVAADEIKLRI